MYDSMFFPSFRLRVNIGSRIVWKQYLLLKPNHRINDRPKNLWCQSASTLGWTVYYDLMSTVNLPRKEVIQPHLPVRLPCDGRCVQGPGTYSPWHADPRLLAIPTSRRRVAACDPNWDGFLGFALPRGFASLCWPPLYYVCSPGHKGHDDLTSSPPSSVLSTAVSLECSCVATNNRGCARCGT